MKSNKGLIATIVVMSAVIITLIVVLIVTQMSSIIQLSELTKKTPAATTEQTTTVIETTEMVETTESAKVEKLKTSIKTYTSHKDRVNNEYPVIEGMDDTSMQEKINKKLYTNAISIVKLYPISTALQRLNITCNVKYINDEYITVLYEGRVVGDSATGNNVNRKGTTTNVPATQAPYVPINPHDPYLDGFIDPLGAGASIPHIIVDPEPVTVIDNNNATTKVQVDKNDNSGTSDSGPTVAKSITPTSPRDANAGMHATGGIISNGVISGETSSNGVYNNPKSQSSNVPVYGNSKTDACDVTVSAHTSTSAASTIDHKIFYTNTIDLKTGLDMTLKDYVKDLSALAKYARSNDVEFVNIDESNRAEVIKYIRKTVQSTLTEYLTKYSDFRNEGVKNWPKHFSYRDEEGTVYFTIKLSSKLGNYAIIKYKK